MSLMYLKRCHQIQFINTHHYRPFMLLNFDVFFCYSIKKLAKYMTHTVWNSRAWLKFWTKRKTKLISNHDEEFANILNAFWLTAITFVSTQVFDSHFKCSQSHPIKKKNEKKRNRNSNSCSQNLTMANKLCDKSN